MRQSQLFTKTIRETPRDEKSINSRLLIKAGFIDKLTAGVYSYLPLGFKVLKKIENIIREEMNKILGQEVFLPALHPKKNWEITDRWHYKEMFKVKSRGGKDFSLGWTHEEIITPLVKKFVQSYKNLPVFVYQIQDKFRDELRVKSGLLRGVEFIMKDLYSFHRDEKDLDKYYEKVKKAYLRIFERCGLGKQTFLTLASGGTFSKYSHEFQTITPVGEDEIYLCQKCKLAVNKEIIKEEKYKCPKCKSKKLEIKKAIEVGNIFKLKDKFSKPFNFKFKDKDGKEKMVLMGCYGIGLGRLMGAVVEVHYDKDGIIWPKEVAPFDCHLLALSGSKKKFERKIGKVSEKLYQDLQGADLKVLYDDRKDKTAGEKFAEADLIGIPIRIVVSEKTLKRSCVEIKRRKEEKIKLIKLNQIINYV
ncbi:MAG: proline--tRNA ligase [Candidatus Nealsonbacteria bacterium]